MPEDSLQYSSIDERLSDIDIPKNGKFILERYVKVNKPNIPLNIDTIAGAENSIDRACIRLEQEKSKYLHRNSFV